MLLGEGGQGMRQGGGEGCRDGGGGVCVCVWGGGCTQDRAVKGIRGASNMSPASVGDFKSITWIIFLGYFSLADGALKSTVKRRNPAVLSLQENQPPSEKGTWDSLHFYYASHILHPLLSKCIFRT